MSKGISAKGKWNVNEASIKRMTNRYIEKNLSNIENVIDWYAKHGADYVERFAVLSGSSTGTAWHRNKNAERGFQYGARVDTGYMARSVGYDSYSFSSDNEIGAEFGIRTPAGGGEDYFIKQEEGFDLKIGSGVRKVKPMNSSARAHAALKPYFRKEMLRIGFLRGKKDVRGTAVLDVMRSKAFKNMNFDTAWMATSPSRSDAQKAAWDKIQAKINRRELNEYLRLVKSNKNRQVIEASRSSSQAGFAAYMGSKIPASKKEAGF